MSCDDAEMFHFSQKRIIFNPNLDSFIQFSFGMGESKPSYKLLVKYKGKLVLNKSVLYTKENLWIATKSGDNIIIAVSFTSTKKCFECHECSFPATQTGIFF